MKKSKPRKKSEPARYREIIKIVGRKGYSKRRIIRFEPVADGEFFEWTAVRSLVARHRFETIEQTAARLSEAASSLLRRCGLPGDLHITYSLQDKKTRVPDHGLRVGYGRALIENYICEILSYAHDSTEGILARIIMAAHLVKNGNQEIARRAIFDLGAAWMELKADHHFKKSGQKAQGKKGASYLPTLNARLQSLRNDHGNLSAAAAWSRLEEGENEDDFSNIWTEGDKLIIEGHSTGRHEIARSTFGNHWNAIKKASTIRP